MHALSGIDRQTKWELVERVPLSFQTFHPQGLAFGGDLTFLSSVEILKSPQVSAEENGSTHRSAGRGTGHIFVMDHQGTLLRDITLGATTLRDIIQRDMTQSDIYHPGGIDFDGALVWVPLAEYRANSRSIIYTVDPATLDIRERFRVADHIGWVVSDRANGLIHGGNWGSRRFYTWTADGSEVSRWENPSGFIDYQDGQYVGGGRIVCGGVAILPAASGVVELGGLAVIDVTQRRIIREFPLPLYSPVGHSATRNPFAVAIDDKALTMWVAPDDGDEGDGTEILKYRTPLAM